MSDCEDYEFDDDNYDEDDEYEYLSYKKKEFLRWYYGKPKLEDCYYDIEQDREYYYDELY